MNKLDIQRPFGRIIGRYEECAGAAYTQDGKFYDVYYNLIERKESNYEKADETRANEQVDGNGEEEENANGQEEKENDEVTSSVSNILSEPVSIPESVLVSEPIPESVPIKEMTLTDTQLHQLANKGMDNLRDYAESFGVKGRAKSDIIKALKALRT